MKRSWERFLILGNVSGLALMILMGMVCNFIGYMDLTQPLVISTEFPKNVIQFVGLFSMFVLDLCWLLWNGSELLHLLGILRDEKPE